MPALSTWVAYTTIVGVFLALFALTRTRIQNWATCRAVYHCKFWTAPHVLAAARPATTVQRRTKLRLWVQRRRHNATMRLVPIVYRVSLLRLVEAVDDELRCNTLSGSYFPSPDSNSLYVEVAAYINHKKSVSNRRSLTRRHRGVRVARAFAAPNTGRNAKTTISPGAVA